MDVLRIIWTRGRGALIASASATVVAGAAGVLLLALIHRAIITAPGSTDTFDNVFEAHRVWIAASALVGLVVVRAIATYTAQRILSRTAHEFAASMRMSIIERMLRLPLREFDDIGAARLLTTLTTDVRTIVGAMQLVPSVLVNVALATGSLGYMFYLSPAKCGAVTALAAVIVLGHRMLVRRAHVTIRKAHQANDVATARLVTATRATKELKMHAPRRRMFLAQQLEPALRDAQRLQSTSHAHHSLAQVVTQGSVVLLVGAVAIFASQGHAVSTEVGTGFVLVLLYLMGPMNALMSSLVVFHEATHARHHIEQVGVVIERAPLEFDANVHKDSTHSSWTSIEVRDVQFGHRRSDDEPGFVLGPVSLSLRRGEVVVVSGENGSGKSTLSRVLMGLYPPDHGNICVDGVTVTDSTREAYRQMFSPVFSDAFVFDSLLAVDSANRDTRANEWLRKLDVHTRVSIANGSLSTTALSQGQRKRLALLLPMLDDRSVYVFDEWAAEQDPQFRERFYNELIPSLRERGKTIVIISHDERYFHVADRHIEMRDGAIVAESSV